MARCTEVYKRLEAEDDTPTGMDVRLTHQRMLLLKIHISVSSRHSTNECLNNNNPFFLLTIQFVTKSFNTRIKRNESCRTAALQILKRRCLKHLRSSSTDNHYNQQCQGGTSSVTGLVWPPQYLKKIWNKIPISPFVPQLWCWKVWPLHHNFNLIGHFLWIPSNLIIRGSTLTFLQHSNKFPWGAFEISCSQEWNRRKTRKSMIKSSHSSGQRRDIDAFS